MEGIKVIDMGQGINLTLAETVLHTEVLNDLKDQLLICLLKKLADDSGRVALEAAELDRSGRYTVAFSMCNGRFDFIVDPKP